MNLDALNTESLEHDIEESLKNDEASDGNENHQSQGCLPVRTRFHKTLSKEACLPPWLELRGLEEKALILR